MNIRFFKTQVALVKRLKPKWRGVTSFFSVIADLRTIITGSTVLVALFWTIRNWINPRDLLILFILVTSLLLWVLSIRALIRWPRGTTRYRFAISSTILLPLLGIMGIVGWQYWQSRPSDRFVVLVADFDGPKPDNYRVTEVIIEELQKIAREYPEVRLLPLSETITEQEGSETARSIGKAWKADMVIWGWYGATTDNALVSIRVEPLKVPETLSIKEPQQLVSVPITELESFTLQFQLATELSYVSLLTIGLMRFQEEDYVGAIGRFTSALSLSPATMHPLVTDETSVYYYRGLAYLLKNEPSSAIKDFDVMVTLAPDRGKVYLWRGWATLMLGNLEQAASDLEKAVVLLPEEAYVYDILGMFYGLQGENDRAIANLNKAIALEPTAIDSLVNRGHAYAAKGSFTEALADYTKVISLDSKNIAAYAGRASVQEENGNLAQALADYTQAMLLQRRSPYPPPAIVDPMVTLASYYNARGLVYYQKGEVDSAMIDFNTAISLDPKLGDAVFNIGSIYLARKCLDCALTEFDKALVIEPHLPEMYARWGDTYSRKGQIDKAISYYDRALILAPDLAEALYGRGLAYADKGDLSRGLENLLAANAFKPGFLASLGRPVDTQTQASLRAVIPGIESEAPPANKVNATVDPYISRAFTYYQNGELEQATAEINQAILLAPADSRGHYGLGNIYAAKGELGKALDEFTKAVDLYPQESQYYANRATTYYNLGDFNLAIMDLYEAIALSPRNARNYFIRASAFYKKGMLKRTVDDCTRSVALDPGSSDSLLLRGIAFQALGKLGEAEDDFKKVLENSDSGFVADQARLGLNQLHAAQ